MPELAIDPHEPVYCKCRQVSFGNMIACDNADVSYLVLAIVFMCIWHALAIPAAC